MVNVNTPSILLINDLAGYGKVALSVMIPIFSHFKCQTFNLPTALVSNTLDYGKFDILDTTSYMKNTMRVWEELDFSFDAICTGLLVSEQQSELIYGFCKCRQAKGAKVFVDPIMGDNGRLYNGVSEHTVAYMRRLCGIGDVIIPNVTEACFLTETPQKKVLSCQDMDGMIAGLRNLGAKSIIITSVNLDGHTCTVVYEQGDLQWTSFPYEEIPVQFPGTGDIFTSMVTANRMKGMALKPSVRIAMATIETLIGKNRTNGDIYKGIPIEHYLDDIPTGIQ